MRVATTHVLDMGILHGIKYEIMYGTAGDLMLARVHNNKQEY